MSVQTIENKSSWNQLVDNGPNGGNILQGREFLEQKAKSGWAIRYLDVNSRAVGVMEKKIPLLGKVWYTPKGPSTDSVADLDQILNELVPFARKNKVFTTKIEPELPHDTDMAQLIDKYSLLKTSPVQYNYATVIVDLAPSENDIMKSLHQKGRHALRRAERDGVAVKQVEPNEENCRQMYKLLRATGQSAGFAVRRYEYYRDFYQAYGDNGGLFFAYFHDQIVAGAFAVVQGRKSMYKDGASLRARPAYGASHLLQWHVIKWAKAKGSLSHDLAGAPPIAHAHDQSHPFYAIGKFKRQFNNQITEYIGAYDVPIISWKAKLWHSKLEKVVRKLYFMKNKESWY